MDTNNIPQGHHLIRTVSWWSADE